MMIDTEEPFRSVLEASQESDVMVQSRSSFGLFLASWTQSLFLHATWDKFPPLPFCRIGQISVNIRQIARPPVKRLTHLCYDIGWIEGIKGAAESHCIAIYSHQ